MRGTSSHSRTEHLREKWSGRVLVPECCLSLALILFGLTLAVGAMSSQATGNLVAQTRKRQLEEIHSEESDEDGAFRPIKRFQEGDPICLHHFSDEQGDRMHERNKYFRRPPDFTALADKYPDFSLHVSRDSKGRAHVDWKNADAARELTRTLLRHDFALDWSLPDGFLCPPVPQRANYLHWVEDLLAGPVQQLVLPSHAIRVPATATGIDVGVGASCIFPLLATSLHPEWRFVGSDINPEALESARMNVRRNGCEDKIELRKVSVDARPLVDLLKESDGNVDFTMCNPPFFCHESEAGGAAHYRSFTGNLQEVVTEGGETRFIERMIQDSAELRGRVRWFTSMVGQKRNLKAVIAKAKHAGASAVLSQVFFQGQTLRWGLAWSFVEGEAQQRRHRMLSNQPPALLLPALARCFDAIPGVSFAWTAEMCGMAGRAGEGAAKGDGEGGGGSARLFEFAAVLEGVGKKPLAGNGGEAAGEESLAEWRLSLVLRTDRLDAAVSQEPALRLFESFASVVLKAVETSNASPAAPSGSSGAAAATSD